MQPAQLKCTKLDEIPKYDQFLCGQTKSNIPDSHVVRKLTINMRLYLIYVGYRTHVIQMFFPS